MDGLQRVLDRVDDGELVPSGQVVSWRACLYAALDILGRDSWCMVPDLTRDAIEQGDRGWPAFFGMQAAFQRREYVTAYEFAADVDEEKFGGTDELVRVLDVHAAAALQQGLVDEYESLMSCLGTELLDYEAHEGLAGYPPLAGLMTGREYLESQPSPVNGDDGRVIAAIKDVVDRVDLSAYLRPDEVEGMSAWLEARVGSRRVASEE